VTVGDVTDDGDGRYTATLTSSTTVHEVTITAHDHSLTGTATLTETAGAPANLTVTSADQTLPADGSSATTVTATLTDGQAHGLAGQTVTFTTDDPGVTIGAVTDQGDGTYTAKLTASRTAHTVTITAHDGSLSGSTTLTQSDVTAPHVTITSPADGATYTVGQSVVATFDCSDDPGGSGIAECVGNTSSGNPIDTSTPGAKVFFVFALDQAGNPAFVGVRYSVVPVTPPTTKLVSAVGKTRAAAITLRCVSSDAPCTGTVALTRTTHHKKVTVASARYTVAAGTTHTVALTLNKAGRRALKAHDNRLRVAIVISGHRAGAVTIGA
jgi:hypothetical protein